MSRDTSPESSANNKQRFFKTDCGKWDFRAAKGHLRAHNGPTKFLKIEVAYASLFRFLIGIL